MKGNPHGSKPLKPEPTSSRAGDPNWVQLGFGWTENDWLSGSLLQH